MPKRPSAHTSPNNNNNNNNQQQQQRRSCVHTQANSCSARIRVACRQFGPQRRPHSRRPTAFKQTAKHQTQTRAPTQTTPTHPPATTHTTAHTHTHIRFAHAASRCGLQCRAADVVSPLRSWPCNSRCVGIHIAYRRRELLGRSESFVQSTSYCTFRHTSNVL